MWHGITDERAWYSPNNGLLDNLGSAEPNRYKWAKYGRQLRNDTTKVLAYVSGMTGYYAGPKLCLVELDGLSDPLLARLPTVDKYVWRIGHFKRAVPVGYVQTMRSGKNELLDSNLARYYDHLSMLTKADIFSWSRLGEIVKFNLKSYDFLLQRYIDAPQIEVNYSQLREPQRAGRGWSLYGMQIMAQNGMTVVLDSLAHNRRVELSVADYSPYRIVFMRQNRELDGVTTGGDPSPIGALAVDTVDVPLAIATEGYDRLKIVPIGGDGRYSVGHVRLLDPVN